MIDGQRAKIGRRRRPQFWLNVELARDLGDKFAKRGQSLAKNTLTPAGSA